MKALIKVVLSLSDKIMGVCFSFSRNLSKIRNRRFRVVFGRLESPIEKIFDRENLTLVGWALANKNSINSISVFIDGQAKNELTYGIHRPDVSSYYSDVVGVNNCGFSGVVNLGKHNKGTVMVELQAALESGEELIWLRKKIRYSSSKTRKFSFLLLWKDLLVLMKKAYFLYKADQLPKTSALWSLAIRKSIRLLRQSRRVQDIPSLRQSSEIGDPYESWLDTNQVNHKLDRLMVTEGKYLSANSPTIISIVVPVFNAREKFLEELIDAVRSQYYVNWELVLVDDGSTLPHVSRILRAASASDERIKALFRPSNDHICIATNAGIDTASGDFIALVDHDDLISRDALLSVVECITQHSSVDWIYTDEDKIDTLGRHYDPQFKGAWNPEMALTHNYTHHLAVIKTSVIREVGGMRVGYEGAQDLDLFLRVAEVVSADNIRHLSKVCYHWRSHEESTASSGTQKTYVFDSAERAIRDAIERRGLRAEPFLPEIAQRYGLCLNQLRWRAPIGEKRLVTILIPTKDRVDLLERCIDSVIRTCDRSWAEILVIDDRSVEAQTLNYFHDLENSDNFSCRVYRPEVIKGDFNYARLINEGVKIVDTPYFLQLNNDVEALNPGWLEDMVGWLSVPGVGVVGARLVYPNSNLQHAGVVVGPHQGLADHQFHNLPQEELGYLGLPHAARNVSAVTGACMLSITECFNQLGGFDEENFAVEYNDVDFCLRVMASGKRIVYTPQACLTHVTSASRGTHYDPKEHVNFIKKYEDFVDPFYNINLSKSSMLMPVSGVEFSHSHRVTDLRILLISHTLSLTGAPIVAFEYAMSFERDGGFDVTVLALEDGPMRDAYSAAGIDVVLYDGLDPTLIRSGGLEEALERVDESLGIRDNFDLIVCNSIASFWGVSLGNHYRVPSILHVHESGGIEGYARNLLDLSMKKVVSLALLTANRVIFQAEATRDKYRDVDKNDNFCVMPGGVPLEKIAEFKLNSSRSTLREIHGLSISDTIVTLIGTTCERKGQEVLLRAVHQLQSRGIESHVKFLLVGAIDGAYLERLRKMIVELNFSCVSLIEETSEIYDYFFLSDMFVCASYEESFPMVVLLAMAFELPIVSTDVFGIPEMLTDNHDAMLIKSGDPSAMANAILSLLENKEKADLFAARAYAKVQRLFDNKSLNRSHIDLMKKVALEDAVSDC